MKIALLQASSQRDKNKLLYDTLIKIAPNKAEVILKKKKKKKKVGAESSRN